MSLCQSTNCECLDGIITDTLHCCSCSQLLAAINTTDKILPPDFTLELLACRLESNHCLLIPVRTSQYNIQPHPLLPQLNSTQLTMFRKKKTFAALTSIEDDDYLPTPTTHGFEKAPNIHQQPEDVDQMTQQQLESLVLNTAKSGKDSTTRALRMATEAREMGVNTAEQMQQQTQQLEKMSEDIEVVHDHLDHSEQIIDKMSKPMLVRLFQRKKTAGKGLNKVKTGKKDLAAREEKRERGLEAIDIGVMKDNPSQLSMDELDPDRQQLFEGASANDSTTSKLMAFGRKKKKEAVQVETRQIREDYSQYSKPVAEVMREQDNDLDQISNALNDMKDLAGAMDSELEYQNDLIAETKNFAAETSKRTKDNSKRVARLK